MRKFIKNFGIARLIIAIFVVVLFVVGWLIKLDPVRSVVDVLTRLGMNAILVLAMVPMIQSGCGLNFGLPVGLIGGMLGALISIQFRVTGFLGILVALAVGALFGAFFGYFYGKLLNRVKGDEMVIATYVGFSFIALMNMMWVVLPFDNPVLVQGYKGESLRPTINIQEYWDKSISGILGFEIPVAGGSILFPTGMFLFVALMCVLVWLFFKSKTGSAMTAVGSNPDYARAAGIDIDKMRLKSVIMSSAIAAVGIVIYEQSYGFVQMYNAAMFFAFPSVAAVLLGGASVKKASITNVIAGTFLYQALLTLTPAVMNTLIELDISDVIRIIVSNGLIIYALTRKGETAR